MSSPTVKELVTPPPSGRKAVLFFWASWHEPSVAGGNVENIFLTLASAATNEVGFYRVEAEAHPQLSQKYGVTVVPSFVLLDVSGSIVDRIDGGDDIPRLTQAVSALSTRAKDPHLTPKQSAVANEKDVLNARLESLINSSQVMLFMKGNPSAPRCGFSRQAVELLTDASIVFGTFDILTDEKVRQGLKEYSDWPTYPQLYVNGELTGGLDIMKDLAEEGDFAGKLGVGAGVSAGGVASEVQEKMLDDRLKELTQKQRVMLFMKGLPSAPRCGFSRQIVEILNNHNTSYEAFDILTDEAVRQGLKKFSDWPTYPQLYVDGDLIGGLDIVKELDESGELQDLLKN